MSATRTTAAAVRARGGFAMVIVLLTLMALLVLCTPFLLTARNADLASTQLADRAATGMALDSAARLAEARLGISHPALDSTPYHDSLEELSVASVFNDPEFLDARDPRGVMFGLDVHDVSGRIDLGSAPPQLLANVMGCAAVTLSDVEEDAKEILVSSAAGFLPSGYIWLENELIAYTTLQGNTLGGLLRAAYVETDADGKPVPCGPQPARAVEGNTLVVDQRAWALPLWRTWTADGTFRELDSIEQLREVTENAVAGELGDAAVEALRRTSTVYAGVGAGRRWQQGSRVAGELHAGADCELRVQGGRWFNPGTTVLITDGETRELGLVRSISDGGITLMDAVANDYGPYRAVVYPLARRPVNVNTAPAEVLRALLTNLQLRRRQSRITAAEAEELVEVIVESRPFTSFEDFVRRLILPAAGWDTLPADAPVVPEAFKVQGIEGPEAAKALQMIDEDDARALYKNALNANDAELAFSTLPFAFTSTDTHQMELRASVNAPSGIERAHAVREQVELIVPQQDLFYAAVRQEDFEAAFRLDCDAPGWTTGPFNTGRYDPIYQSSPPPRSRAHLGPHDSMQSQDPLSDKPVYTFASRDEEEQAFAMPWAARTEEITRRQGRVLHFDDGEREIEGRYLPDGTLALDPAAKHVGWVGASGLMTPFSFSMWIRPEAAPADGMLFLDVGGPYTTSDRVSLAIEGTDLVLRVRDAGGDHPATTFEEQGEIRYRLAESGEDPGMPLETWINVEAEVRGNRPDLMSMRVDGRWSTRIPGLTRLTAAIGPETGSIPVESTEGFPEHCVLRIGNELIEAVVAGEKSFTAVFESEGENAGFGGRLARQQFLGIDPGVPVGLLNSDGSYDAGTPVMHYGYAQPVVSNVSIAEGTLGGDVGPFRVGRVARMGAGQSEIIEVQTTSGFTWPLGIGLETQPSGTLVLEPVDSGAEFSDEDLEELMSSFNPSGGFAVLMSVAPQININSGGILSNPATTVKGTRLGGIEVIHYSGVNGNELYFDRRGDAVNLPNLAGAPAGMAGKGAFVFDWDDIWTTPGGPPDMRLTWHTKIFPISLRVNGAGSFDPASIQDPKVAQITELGADSGLTEWVRYDFISGSDLVRDDPLALLDAWFAVQGGTTEDNGDATVPGGGPGGGGGGGGGGGTGVGGPGGGGAAPPPAGLMIPPAPPASPPPALDGSYWHYRMGEEEDADKPVSRAVWSYFQFRGVFGTYPHRHSAGRPVLPTFTVADVGLNHGLPGRFDPVILTDADPSDPGFPAVVHHSHRPSEYTVYHWSEIPGEALGVTTGAGPATRSQTPTLAQRIHIGLEDGAGTILAAGTTTPTTTPIYDSRMYARILKHPSGELPRGITSVAIGGAYGGGSANVPAATVDEIIFGTTDFAAGEDTWGSQMVLTAPISDGEDSFDLAEDELRMALGRFHFQGGKFLSAMPEDAGLLRIGDEILCYAAYDESSGAVTVATGGRGLLGTDPQPHAAGEGVSILQHLPVSLLTTGVGADDARLELASVEDFPSSGLVLIEDELVHYTWIDGTTLGMPALSKEPGAMDGEGAGLFRARFGTRAAGHGAGTPVILFPFRYWDRWTEKADAPELNYLGLSLSQPNAFWQSVFWDSEDLATAGPRLGVLQRTRADVPWDADPDAVEGLDLLWDGLAGGEGNPIGEQADRIEWRVFATYEPGSFDPEFGLAHGWKAAPKLELFGAEYLGPGMVLRRVAR